MKYIKIPLYFPLECESMYVRARARVCELSIKAAACLSSLQSVRDQGEEYSTTLSPAQHYSQSLLSSFLKRDTFLPKKPNGNDTQHLNSGTFFFFESVFLNSQNCPAFI